MQSRHEAKKNKSWIELLFWEGPNHFLNNNWMPKTIQKSLDGVSNEILISIGRV